MVEEICVEILIKFGADMYCENDLGLTPLCFAVQNNNLSVIKKFVDLSYNLNYVLKSGKFEGGTIMHFGAAYSELESIKLMIELGADTNFKDWRGRTPLHWAAREGKVSIMKHLLFLSGWDLYLEDHGGLTLLHLAAAGGNVSTANWLLLQQFDKEAKDITGWTPLHRAADSGQLATINLLLDHGADIQAITRHGSTPLHFAALRGQIEAVKLLIERGAHINARDNYTWTPLRMSVTSQNTEIADYLRSLDLFYVKIGQFSNKNISMNCKIKEDEFNCVEFLIKYGAEIEVENNSGFTPLCLAAESNNLLAIETLSFYGSNVNQIISTGTFEGGTIMHFAAANSEIETINLLLELGGNVILKDWRGRLPLHWAAREGKVEVLELLLDISGGDLYLQDNGGLTLLHLAAAGGNSETLKWLLKQGFDLEIKENTGWTPLHSAADSGQVSTIEILLDNNANINAKTWQRSTPLHFAAFRGQNNAVKTLVERGAPINARDQNCWTPLCMAMASKHSEITEFLQSLGGHTGDTSRVLYRNLF